MADPKDERCAGCADASGCAGCPGAADCTETAHLREEQLAQEEIYNGRILRVTRDTVRLENGTEALREVIHHPGGACVVPLTDDGKVLMVRQYRYPQGTVTLEVPAGKLEYGEDPKQCAVRELREETGADAKEFYALGHLFPTPAYDKEIIYMFLAQGLHFTEQDLDADEFLDVVRVPLYEAVKMVMRNELPDAKTQIAILKTYQLITGEQ